MPSVAAIISFMNFFSCYIKTANDHRRTQVSL
jgi:hypothetical protein